MRRDWVVNFVVCRQLSLRITSEMRLELFGEKFFPILFSSVQSFLLILSFGKNPVIERNSPSLWQWQAVVYLLLISGVMDISWLMVGLVQVSLTSSCFFILFFSWLFVSSQKHERSTTFQAQVQLCMIINNMNPNFYHIYCHMHVFVLIPGKTLNSVLQPRMNAKQICEKNTFNYYFFVWWRTVYFKEWPVIHHKKQKRNHSLPPNSAVLLSLPAVFRIQERYSAVCSVCISLPMLGNLISSMNIHLIDWRKGCRWTL